MQLVIWTEAYRPFIMGGDVNTPIGCRVEVDDANIHKLTEDVTVAEITSPCGKTRVAEVVSGAIVGTYMPEVIADVATAAPEVMRKQIQDAITRRDTAVQVLPADEFWRMCRE